MFVLPVASPLSRQQLNLARSLDRLLDSQFDRPQAASQTPEVVGTRSPALDVAETDSGYTVTLDLPGVAKENVQVSIEGRRVNIAAQAQKSDGKTQADRVVYRERAPTSYARSFSLPAEVDQAEAQAKLEHGVLTLALPKRTARKASQITIN